MKLPVFKKAPGFTLIELLVVIALIGILAVAVLSALNPTEQVNKAKDAKMSADASQLLSAIDRYYAANFQFPWTMYRGAPTYQPDSPYGAPAYFYGVGVCGNQLDTGVQDLDQAADTDGTGSNGCVEDGLLIESQEMKSGFGGRDYFKTYATGNPERTLWLFKPSGDPTVYICYKPASKVNKDKATLVESVGGPSISNLKYLGWGDPVSGGDFVYTAGEVPTDMVTCDPGDDGSGIHPPLLDWGGDPDDYCFVCVPE